MSTSAVPSNLPLSQAGPRAPAPAAPLDAKVGQEEGGSDVELVLVSAVDGPANPQNVDVYLFPADEVRKRFDASYAARIASGHTVRENYGMWVKLDAGDPEVPSQVGAGLADDYPRIARFSLDELEASPTSQVVEEVPAALQDDASQEEGRFADVCHRACARGGKAARLAGMERQALHDAVVRYSAEGLVGLVDTAPRAAVAWC